MLAQQHDAIASLFRNALQSLDISLRNITLERPKNPRHGDIACNVAMQTARLLKKNPREIAQQIVNHIESNPASTKIVRSISIAGPGFINLFLTNEFVTDTIHIVLQQGDCFGNSDEHKNQNVLLEFVSANPTGPLHLGHARQAALGDVLANLMQSQGWNVTREFYYNDAGVQISNLTKSVQLRARQILGEDIQMPERAYHGEYILAIAQDYLNKVTIHTNNGQIIRSQGDINDDLAVRKYAVAYLRNEQDDDLSKLGVKFDNFYLESSLYTSHRVEKAVNTMIASGHTYESEDALWLRTTDFSDLGHGIVDDKDRVMRKTDGTYTYFVPDVAYHLAKFERGFDKAINIQGSDHHGTIARVRAGLQACSQVDNLNIPKEFPEYILHKMLSVVKDGEPVKMSKRSGNYVTLRDLVDWAGRDAARFFLVERKADAEFVFDIDLALAHSDENPVYYLQYAHTRICSVFNKAQEKGFTVPTAQRLMNVDLTSLNSDAAQQLIQVISEYPSTLAQASRDKAPHTLCHYLKKLAAALHGFYNNEHVLVEDRALREARFAILMATQQVFRNGFSILGISAPTSMERLDSSK